MVSGRAITLLLSIVIAAGLSQLTACGGSSSTSAVIPYGTMESEEGYKFTIAEEGSPAGGQYEDKSRDPREAAKTSEETPPPNTDAATEDPDAEEEDGADEEEEEEGEETAEEDSEE